jgi:16S rRNA (cytosine1407-C5)-methyltransferase
VQKKGEVSNWWNEAKAQSLAEIQYRLLVSAIKMVRPLGEIVYSTCTLTLEENELVLDKILRKYPVSLADIDLPVKSINAFTEAGGLKLDPSIVKAKRILPWEIGSEGFFVAKLVKNEPDDSARPVKDSFDKTAFVNSNSQKIKKYLDAISSYYGIDRSEFDRFKYIIRSKDIYFINREWAAHSLDSFLRLGSKFGIIDKHDFLQLNSLAVQVLADKIKSNIVELKLKSELDTYFKGGTIKDFPSSPGPKVVKYSDFYLGSASATKEGLKSQLPRHFRTQEILLTQICH